MEKPNPRAISLRENSLREKIGPGFGSVNGSGAFTAGDAIVGSFPVEAESPIERELGLEVELLNLLEEKLRILELRIGSVVSPSDPVPSGMHGRDTVGCSGVFQRLYENNHRLALSLDFIDDLTRRVEL